MAVSSLILTTQTVDMIKTNREQKKTIVVTHLDNDL